MTTVIAIIGFILGFLFREWSRWAQKGMNWIKNRPHKKRFIAFAKNQLDELKKNNIIEDYKIEGVCFTCPMAHVNVKMGSRKAMRGFQVVPPNEEPPPPRGA